MVAPNALKRAIAALSEGHAETPAPAPAAVDAAPARLTNRETEVLGYLIDGYSNREAGEAIGISPRTIEVHRARIVNKLGAKNAADMVRRALELNTGMPG